MSLMSPQNAPVTSRDKDRVKIKNKNKMKTNYSADYIAKSEALKSHPTTKLADAYEAWIAASYGTDNEAYAKADAAYAVLKKLHNKKSK